MLLEEMAVKPSGLVGREFVSHSRMGTNPATFCTIVSNPYQL